MAGLLLGLSQGAALRRLAAIELARRDLEQVAARGVPVLAHQQHLIGRDEGDDRRRPRVSDHLERRDVSVRKGDAMDEQMDHAALVDLASLVDHDP